NLACLSTIDEPRVLCLGLGVGVLSDFLRVNLGFKIVGVEINTSIITNAEIFYEFNKSDDNVVINENAIDVVNQFASGSLNIFKPNFRNFLNRVGAGEKFQAIILDINSADKRAPFGVCSPPKNFVSHKCLRDMSKCLDDHGLLIINVVSPNYVFYSDLVELVKSFYAKVYKSKPDDEKTFILYALKSAEDLSGNSDFLGRLETLIPDWVIKGIVEI
ncbi:methyltransferase-like protein 13, partial [Tanacetum coccineum]